VGLVAHLIKVIENDSPTTQRGKLVMKKIVQLAEVPANLKVKIYHVPTKEVQAILTPFGKNTKKMPRYYTVARVIDRDTMEVVAEGDALCSYKDTPSRKLGRAIAHNRALKAYAKGTASFSEV
jgi:endonuclease YncB( thermonuclease family)